MYKFLCGHVLIFPWYTPRREKNLQYLTEELPDYSEVAAPDRISWEVSHLFYFLEKFVNY